MSPTWTRDDDDPAPKDFSREDVIEIRKLLLAVEEGHLLHFNDPAQLEVFKRVMHTFTEHKDEIAEIIKREQVSKLRTETRLKMWGLIKWFLVSFLLIVGVVQGWQSVIAPLVKWGAGK